MHTLRTRTGQIIAGGVLAAALALGGAGAALAQGHVGPSGGMPFAPGASGTASAGETSTYGPGFGMMGGQGYGPGAGQAQGQVGYGPGGMMGGSGISPGSIAGNYPGPTSGMMGGWFGGAPAGPTISMAQAQQDVQAYLDRLGNADLRVDEVMEFQDNFYAIVKERNTGIGAFEVLINRSTGAVLREPGPDMLWNTRYGMLSQNSWMGQAIGYTAPTGPMTVSADQARQIAQGWLDANQPGSTTETPDVFYGYYTLHILKGGTVTGMLSVNGYTGQVWYHTWHGAFIQMTEAGQ